MTFHDNPGSTRRLPSGTSYDIIARMRIRLLAYVTGLLLLLAGCGQAVAVTTESVASSVLKVAPTSLLSPVELPTAIGSPTPVARPTKTPFPSATPKPTATPVVYVIHEGDTLLAIAAQYGISLEAIRIANPQLRPELLQIGQQVVIPPPTEENRSAGFLPSPTPVPLVVTGEGWYTTPIGGLWFMGEVVNETGLAVENVRLGVTLYSQGGRVLAELDTWVAAEVVADGAASPFGLLFGPLSERLATYETRLLSSEPVTRGGVWHPDLTISESNGEFEGTVYRISGIVQNTGVAEATEVTLVATLYDHTGQITGFLRETLSDPLPPATHARFELWLAPVGPGTERYGLTVSGHLLRERG
jgi:LysM repeat protein